MQAAQLSLYKQQFNGTATGSPMRISAASFRQGPLTTKLSQAQGKPVTPVPGIPRPQSASGMQHEITSGMNFGYHSLDRKKHLMYSTQQQQQTDFDIGGENSEGERALAAMVSPRHTLNKGIQLRSLQNPKGKTLKTGFSVFYSTFFSSPLKVEN